MLTDLRRERGDACLSDLRLDAWQAGELDADGEARAAAHVDGCERCRRRKAELDADRERFLARSPAPPVRATEVKSAKAPRKSRVIPLRAWAGVALSAAALVALFVALSPGSRGGGDIGGAEAVGDRVKGSHRLGFFVKRGSETFEGLSGQRVLPGDQLRFVVTLRAPAHVAVLSRDGAGQASVYFPAGGTSAPRFDAAGGRGLDGAVELDATLGRERLWGVFCAESFEVGPLREALSASGELTPPPGCTLDEIELIKVASP